MQRMTSMDDSKLRRHSRLSEIFTPGAPVNRRDLFAGRVEQILQVLSAVKQPGQQVVLYGERGVGKTSLANLLSLFVPTEDNTTSPTLVRTARINCSTQDTFKSIWTKVLRSLDIAIPEDWAFDTPDPDTVRVMLDEINPPAFVILDEFDRWEDDDGLSLMADTLKALSDHFVKTKIVLVGVADSIDGLIGEHESVQRAIEEVPMPRMSQSEILDIPTQGFKVLGMTIAGEALVLVSNLAEGLPHYAHLLSLYAGQRAVLDDRSEVSISDVLTAVNTVVEGRHSALREYQVAVRAQRKDTLYERVLLACALAEKDKLGFFSASAVREPLSEIMKRPYDIPAFAPHLKAFTGEERGMVLKREGPTRRYRYRFRNPLLQPFTIITALSEGWLPEKYKTSLFLGRV